MGEGRRLYVPLRTESGNFIDNEIGPYKKGWIDISLETMEDIQKQVYSVTGGINLAVDEVVRIRRNRSR